MCSVMRCGLSAAAGLPGFGNTAALRAGTEADAKVMVVEPAVIEASEIERPRVRKTVREIEVAHGGVGADRKRSFATGIQ